MNRTCLRFAAVFIAVSVWSGTALGAESTSTPLAVSELIVNRDKYVDTEIVVRGYIEISDLWRFSEATHNLYESKAVVDKIRKDWKTFTDGMKRVHTRADKLDDRADDASREMDELEQKYCITISPVKPFLRNGKYLTDRVVVLQGKLIKLIGLELTSGCKSASGLMLEVDEVIDPPASKAKSNP